MTQTQLARLSSKSLRLRETLSRLLVTSNPERIIFGPGILNSLQLFFCAARLRRLAISSEEYYGRAHFVGQEVQLFNIESLERDLEGFNPDAVLLSLVSWRGEQLPVNRIFERIRRTGCTPLFVIDYAHGGAAGFPSIDSLKADLVCGDFSKWITPPGTFTRLTFSIFRSTAAFDIARSAFASFFLATGYASPGIRAARWVDPAEMSKVVRWFRMTALDRQTLLDQHEANKRLAHSIAQRLGLWHDEKTSILWMPGASKVSDPTIEDLERSGLVWAEPSGNTRILCRAQYATYNSAQASSQSPTC